VAKHRIAVEFTELGAEAMLELDEDIAPKTVRAIMTKLPIQVAINRWGDELYTDELPVRAESENARTLVQVMDVAFWPEGNALCLFFGPTPISKGGEIKPYSAVNVVGRILGQENLARRVGESTKVVIRKA
jgi:hypothetical protein